MTANATFTQAAANTTANHYSYATITQTAAIMTAKHHRYATPTAATLRLVMLRLLMPTARTTASVNVTTAATMRLVIINLTLLTALLLQFHR